MHVSWDSMYNRSTIFKKFLLTIKFYQIQIVKQNKLLINVENLKVK